RTTVPTGRETVYAFNVVGPLQPLLLVGFVLASAPAAWRRPGLPTGALALAIAGGLAASGSMLTLVALGGLRPFDGVESLAFAAFAFGLGLAQAGLGAAALAVSQASLPPRPANPEEGAAAST
ncbi:MAG TPA: hypothetical protein VM582_01220, partial [Candidatus Thermoplasmatota archaeon]|nr:hypothetical protein [Candidatus Thermoplasmatota archaeon]